MPVECRAEPAGPGGSLGRAGVEQDAIGHRGIAGQRQQIGRGFDRHRLHHRQSEGLLDVAQPRHGFPAVKLQNIRPQGLDDVGERRVVGIDRERHLDGAASGPLAEIARGLKADMTGRGRKEHESNHVGAGLQRGIQGLAAWTGHKF